VRTSGNLDQKLIIRSLRVAGLCVTLLTCTAFGVWHVAKAKFEETAYGLSPRILEGAAQTAYDQEQPFLFNGERFYLSSGTRPTSLRRVMHNFAVSCVEQVPRNQRKSRKPLILHSSRKQQGFVLCLKQQPGKNRSLGERLAELRRTQDLAALGRFGYIYARQRQEQTEFVSVWTGASLRPLRMFPKGHDAPGSDLPDVPRLSTAERRFSISTTGQQMVSYTLQTSVRQAKRLWLSSAIKSGWHLRNDGHSRLIRTYKNQRELIWSFQGAEGSPTQVSILSSQPFLADSRSRN